MAYRINGDIVRKVEVGIIKNEVVELMLRQLLNGNPQRFDKFLGDKDMDFAYVSKNGVPYRVNAFLKTGRVGIVMRKINRSARVLDELMFKDIADTIKQHILTAKKGLFLVTGATGSGKTTSLIAMLQHINQNRTENLITIEDPIEFIFTPDKCLISQREIGHDTWSFANALRASLREDPDVIFVGEIRDRETAESVLMLAESGHLVFSTLHTQSAALTINRYISFFPPDIQTSIADRMSEVLLGVQSQTLVKTKDKSTRIGVFEVMINNTSIRNNIKENDVGQINSIIETSSARGMISMKQYAEKLATKGIIDEETYKSLVSNDI
ncbi:MAG: PilT/PilU family type 4a pilus ATPase [Candidatus Peribacteria bacterium]|nr:MAG: PilT/PilU family type 4a pilus ATPase [Candidatus Peribacteria bacterium]